MSRGIFLNSKTQSFIRTLNQKFWAGLSKLHSTSPGNILSDFFPEITKLTQPELANHGEKNKSTYRAWFSLRQYITTEKNKNNAVTQVTSSAGFCIKSVFLYQAHKNITPLSVVHSTQTIPSIVVLYSTHRRAIVHLSNFAIIPALRPYLNPHTLKRSIL